MNFHGKKIGIIGLGKSGYWSAKLASSLNCNVFISDINLDINHPYVHDLKQLNIEVELGKHSDRFLDCDLVIKSPGIPNRIDIINKISNLNIPKYYYEVVFDKPGGLVMPIIIDVEYEDGTVERRKYPAQVWRKNDSEVRKVLTSDKKIVSIKLDPDEETADIDTSNNSWPKVENESDFDKFKSQIKG